MPEFDETIKPRIDFEKKQAVKDKAEKQLRSDVARVSATEEGRNVLRSLMSAMGYQTLGVDCNRVTGETFLANSVYHAGRRDLWITFRTLIPHKDLVEIENQTPPPIKEENEDG